MADPVPAPAPAPAPAAAPAPAPAPAPATWYAGADEDTVGALTSKGWKDLEPAKAAIAAAQSYRMLEKLHGDPANLVRLKTDDPAAMEGVYAKLGVPKDVKGYVLPKEIEDQYEGEFLGQMRATALKTHMTPLQFQEFATELRTIDAKITADEKTLGDAKTAKELDALKTNWGTNFESNWFVAEQGAKALGLSADMMKAIGDQIGPAVAAETFRKLGVRLGEDRYVQDAPNGRAPMTVDDARLMKAQKQADPVFMQKATNPDSAEYREYENLNLVIAGLRPQARRAA